MHDTIRRGQYRTTSAYQLEDRRLLLLGGGLDGLRWAGTVQVGQRVFCGTGAWSPKEIYLVTAEVAVDGVGHEENIAVPAFATP